MTTGSFTGLLNNAILLLALGVIYDVIRPRYLANRYMRKIMSGLLIGSIGIMVMLNPWELMPGVFFDTRWVLLGLCGLFFGLAPTLIAVAMTVGFRLSQGGAGVVVGSLVILLAAAIGLGWRYWVVQANRSLTWLDLYGMGLVIQIAVLSSMFLMPQEMQWRIFSEITVPVLVIFPVVTLLFGLLLRRQHERQKAEHELQISENRFRSLFESSEVCIWNVDYSAVLERFRQLRTQGVSDLREYLEGNRRQLLEIISETRIIQVNDACVRMFGASSAQEFLESRLFLFTPEVTAVFLDHLCAIWEGKSHFRSEVKFRDLQGRIMIGIISLPIPENEKDFDSIPVSLLDITESKQAEDSIHVLSQAVEQSPVSVMITNPEGEIEYVNSAFEQVTGYRAAEVVGKSPQLLKSGHTSPKEYERLWKTISSGGAWRGEFLNARKDGELFWEHAHIAPVMDATGRVRHYLAVKEDTTHQKEQEQRILHQAHYDSLTDLPNRFLSLDRLSQLIKESERDGSMVGVLFLDLDDFKKINDSLGHDTGDRLLVQAAERLHGTVRDGDTIGRLGGDEFIMLMGGLTDAMHARSAAENLLETLRSPFSLDERELILSASIGISVYPDDGKSPLELLRKADTAMYCSKDQGRNTYNYFTESMNQDVSRRLMLEELLHGALERNEFYLRYQPVVDVRTKRIIGAEALLRWEPPTLGNISPEEFIPITEQTGLIVKISQYVLGEALKKTAEWQRNYTPDFKIAVNLSPRQFRDPGLLGDIERILHSTSISSDSLDFEITEGVLMTGTTDNDTALKALNDLGVGISMDDFGTGYSSLSYLRKYPFDTLKIDRSFISDITHDQSDRELINAAIVMAHSLDMKVVAEGVETEEQYAYLDKQGCDYAQGYLFSRPVTPAEIASLLQQQEPVHP
jgi:diguanylate cyclase (GGDEF)-like protein/PAS domain S-box-containing protein